MDAQAQVQRPSWTLGLLIVAAVAGLLATVPAQAQSDQRCFPETGFCISGRIREYLEDVARADAPATIIGRQTIVANGQQVPFAFEIPYDPATLSPMGRFVVRARITVDGQLRYISTQSYPVITGNNPSVVEIVVDPV